MMRSREISLRAGPSGASAAASFATSEKRPAGSRDSARATMAPSAGGKSERLSSSAGASRWVTMYTISAMVSATKGGAPVMSS